MSTIEKGVLPEEKEENLYILTESLENGVVDIMAIYAFSDLDVAQYLIDNAKSIAMFEDHGYYNLFTYILDFIEKGMELEVSDDDYQYVLDNLTDYLTPQDLLDIIEHSKIDHKKTAGYSLYEISLPNIVVAFPKYSS